MQSLLSAFHPAFIIVEVILLFNLIIIAHELGHFWAARWRGLVVDKFGIWFGKPIWSKTYKGVEYSLGSIPAGGFVSLPQMASMETMEGKTHSDKKSLPPVKPLDKIIVAAAGPAASMLLALFFGTIIWIVGRPISEMESTTKIGYVIADSPAANAGLLPGDKILEVDGKTVERFAGMNDIRKSINWNVASSTKDEIEILIQRNGQTIPFLVKPKTPEREGWSRKELRQIGVYPAQSAVIARTLKDSPAQQAGLKPRDVILEANGTPIWTVTQLPTIIKDLKPQSPLNLLVKRGDQTLEITAIPTTLKEGETPKIGIEWDQRGVTQLEYPNPFAVIWDSLITMKETLGALTTKGGDIDPEHLSGPVGIMRVYYLLFESQDGWRLAIWFSIILNVNLALINLLPIPVLDGGHITLSIIEAIRRKPLNPKFVETIQSAFAMLIIGYMLYVTFFDIQDLPWPNLQE
jgi:regulator of sigma E protease